MCHGCWVSAGSPTQAPPRIERFAELADRLYYELGCSTGGPLHLVLDDWNLETENIEWSVEQLDAFPDRELPEVELTCREIAAIMLKWSEPERYAAMGHWEGYAEPDSIAIPRD